MIPSLAILPTWRVVISRANAKSLYIQALRVSIAHSSSTSHLGGWPNIVHKVVHSGRAMLRRPLGSSQAALARPSHCVHTLWSHIEVITHNAEVAGNNKIFKKKKNRMSATRGAHPPAVRTRLSAKTSTLFGSGQMRKKFLFLLNLYISTSTACYSVNKWVYLFQNLPSSHHQ